MNEKELAIRLTQLGVTTQRQNVDKYTEANLYPDVQQVGNAAIANSLESLGRHSIVVDVQPTFGQGGLGFSYKINSDFVREALNDEAVVRRILMLFSGATSETSSTVARLRDDCERVLADCVYKDDLLASLKELQICFDNACYIACLALSGKILEVCLKQIMLDHKIDFDDGWMIGKLLHELKESKCPKYVDQSLDNIGRIINQSRISAVHALGKIPVPSREQATMVIHAVVDTVQRAINQWC